MNQVSVSKNLGKDIGERVRAIRIKIGLSQDRLSKLADLSLNTIVNIESGLNSNPTVDTLIKIANGLNVSMDSLIK